MLSPLALHLVEGLHVALDPLVRGIDWVFGHRGARRSQQLAGDLRQAPLATQGEVFLASGSNQIQVALKRNQMTGSSNSTKIEHGM